MAIEYYFAYGSNMNPQRVRERGLVTIKHWGAQLRGYRLVFDKQSKDHVGIGHANIQVAAEQIVEGVVYQLESEAEILKMDPYERAPWNYGRDVVQVRGDEGSVWSWTYFANPAVLQDGLAPSDAYLAHLLAGKPYLSTAYCQMLEAWPTA